MKTESIVGRLRSEQIIHTFRDEESEKRGKIKEYDFVMGRSEFKASLLIPGAGKERYE